MPASRPSPDDRAQPDRWYPPADSQTGYRCYSASQLGQLNRIVALKELGLSLAQAKQLLAGITPEELRGMLMLRRAQLEQELARTHWRTSAMHPIFIQVLANQRIAELRAAAVSRHRPPSRPKENSIPR